MRLGVYGVGQITTSKRGTLFSGMDVREAPVLAWYEDDSPRRSLELACLDVKARREAGEDVRVVEQTTYGPDYPGHDAYRTINNLLDPAVAA